jgi:hypothetical protein
VSPAVNEIFRTSPQPSGPFSPFNLNRTNLALEERRNLLSGFLSSNSKKQVGEYIPHFTTNLRRLVPERQEGELSKKVQQLFDPSNKHPLYQLFEFATYFSSHNILTGDQTNVFLKWVIDQNHTDLLKSFLQIKTRTVQAFSIKILESGIRIKDTKLLQLLLVSGIRLDRVLEQAFKIKDPEFLTLLLHSGVDSSLLSGISGERLLYSIAGTRYTKIAQILIQNGAEVNVICDGIYTTSLYKVIEYNNVDMVKCLLVAGAQVGIRSRYEYAPNTALGLAVFNKYPDIVVALLEKGADVNSCSIHGENVLEWAALNAKDIYHTLLEKTGRDDRRVTSGDIIYAAERGVQVFSNFVCLHEARLTQRQLEKALKDSISHSKFRATSTLLGDGVDPNVPTLGEDDRPLMAAAVRDGIKYSQLLVNAGASVNLPGLLVLAVEQDNFELLNLLIEAGADLEMYGPEALENAVQNESIEMAALLLDNGTAANACGSRFTGL